MMRAVPWILGGGGAALAVYLWYRGKPSSEVDPELAERAGGSSSSDRPADAGKGSTPGSAAPERLPGRWVWPVGTWSGRQPEISSGFSSRRRLPDGRVVTHGGVDIMFPRRPEDRWRPGTPNGSRDWIMPDHRAALAASDGVVWSATKTARGCAVVVDHSPRKLATYYTHLSSLLVSAKQVVTAGTPLGIIGADPLDPEHVMHLHFEVWRGGASDRFDPQQLIEATWARPPDPGDLPRTLVA